MRPVHSSRRVTLSRRPSRRRVVDHALERARRRARAAVENERWLRSRLLGVNTISGRPFSTSAWRRSRWKYCAGRGDVRDADVALGREREEALLARARVLGAGALVAVRQQQREPRGLAPLGEPRDDELVDDHLRGVHEVAELRLPHHERLRRLDAVAVLEPERARLRERAVVDLERAPRRRCRCWIGAYALAGLGVDEHQVALAERAARAVLAGEPQRRALHRAASRTRAPPPGPSRRGRRRRPRARFSRCGASLRCTWKPSGAEKTCAVELEQLVEREGRLGLDARRAVELHLRGRGSAALVLAPARAPRRAAAVRVLEQALGLLRRDDALRDERSA